MNFCYTFVLLMKVHLIKRKSIEDFVSKHGSSKSPFVMWLTALKFADWESPDDILQTFGSADILGNGTSRVVFNIGGNNYRMICKYKFGDNQVHLFVCWIGSHRDYDTLCKNKAQYLINNY